MALTPTTRTVKVEVFRTNAALEADPQLVTLRTALARGGALPVLATRIAYTRPANTFGQWVGVEVDFAD